MHLRLKIVEHGDAVAVHDKTVDEMGADVAGSAGDED
jgi:hypothetical protein